MKPRQQQKRLCDYCNDTTALLYCRADSAKLCFSCDHEVHSTNQLFSKHTRSLLCDACHASPVSIFCQTEHSVFCQNCDWERHSLSSLSSTHIRRPIEGFTGCPSGNELMTILGFEDLGLKKSLFFSEESDGFLGSELDDGCSDLFLWDSPAVCIDDLIVSSDSGSNFQTLGVPPLPKVIIYLCFLIITVKLKLVCLRGFLFASDEGSNSAYAVLKSLTLKKPCGCGRFHWFKLQKDLKKKRSFFARIAGKQTQLFFFF